MCRGRGWIGYDVDIRHPWFGRAFPCCCKIAEHQGRRREWVRSVCGLNSRQLTMTLSTFERKRQPEGYDAAALFLSGKAEQPWLVLQGESGTGKTHLASAIVNGLVGQSVNAVYAYVPDVLEKLRFGYEDGTFRAQWEYLRGCQVLALDDILESRTDWVDEKLTQLLDYRLREGAATVVAMNLDLGELPPRLQSRLSDAVMCRLVLMRRGDFRITRSAPAYAPAAEPF